MVATVWLLGCVLAPAQPATRPVPVPAASPAGVGSPRGDWVLTPKLGRGQELVYRGTFTETAGTSRVEFQRAYRLEARYFTLDALPRGTDLVAMTILYTRDNSPPQPRSRPRGRARRRSAPARFGWSGSCSTSRASSRAATGVSLAVPLDRGAGPRSRGVRRSARAADWPSIRAGKSPRRAGRYWPGGSSGTEIVAGQTCVKVLGTQQSDDW